MTCHNLLESQVKDWIFLASLITLLFVGSALADDNQLEKQIKLANAILARPNVSTSDRVQCYLALASSHNQLRNFAQALAEIKKAIALDKSLEESSAVIGVRAEAEINEQMIDPVICLYALAVE